MNNKHFILDIGTRFVRGLICEKTDENPSEPWKCGVRITDCEIREHKSRAMLAGQIHDIEKVSEIVNGIKEALESRQGGEKLSSVAVAVAGRSLMTRTGVAALPRAGHMPVTGDEIRQVEMAAVQNALETFSTETEYYCVGYSTVAYRLDGDEIMNLAGHRGQNIGAEVLVTLLPRQVLEAMFEVAKRAGLEIDYLTLEPIAAFESSITEEMRPLSIVLIDIGAGTSDIAVVYKGKIRSYGMVPVAGDVLTEMLCAELLVDFNTGERLKREAGSSMQDAGRTLEFRDIFNRGQSMTCGALLDRIRPAVASISKRLSEEVLKITDGNISEYAVILVGGGSLTPFIEHELSNALNMPSGRIGARPVHMNGKIADVTGKLGGPDAATASGIGLMAARRAGLSLTHITVNDRRITAVSSERNPTVLSVLLSNGVNIRQIYGRPGLAKTFTLNGEFRTLKGEPPKQAAVEINGKKAQLDEPVQEGDKLVFYPAVDGRDASARIADVLQLPKVRFNGLETGFAARITVNGSETDKNATLEDRMDIQCVVEPGLKALFTSLGLDPSSGAERRITVDSDGDMVELRSSKYELKVNGAPAGIDYAGLKENDEIEFKASDPGWKIADVVSVPQHGRDLKIKINGEEFVFPGGKGKILRNGHDSALDEPIADGDIIRTVPGKDAEAVLVDVFKYVQLDPNNQLGKKIKLLIDGQESQYTSPLHDNAEVKVFFE